MVRRLWALCLQSGWKSLRLEKQEVESTGRKQVDVSAKKCCSLEEGVTETLMEGKGDTAQAVPKDNCVVILWLCDKLPL